MFVQTQIQNVTNFLVRTDNLITSRKISSSSLLSWSYNDADANRWDYNLGNGFLLWSWLKLWQISWPLPGKTKEMLMFLEKNQNVIDGSGGPAERHQPEPGFGSGWVCCNMADQQISSAGRTFGASHNRLLMVGQVFKNWVFNYLALNPTTVVFWVWNRYV